jgi:hypothetical protein
MPDNEIRRLTVICEHADGTLKEYRTELNPAGMTWRFGKDGSVRPASSPDNPVCVTVTELRPVQQPYCECCADNECECDGTKLA